MILKLASDSDETLRSAALKYFLDNYSRYPTYDPANFANLAFVPARDISGKLIVVTPNEAFVEPENAIFGFSVVDSSIRDSALDKLKIKKNPPASRLIALLEKSSPQDPSKARQWFEILAGHISGLILISF